MECTIAQVGSSYTKPAYEDQVLTFQLSSPSEGSGKQPEVPLSGQPWTPLPAVSSPDSPRTLALRTCCKEEIRTDAISDSHVKSERHFSHGHGNEVKALTKVKVEESANLFLDGTGDPMAFFYNSPAIIGGILAEVTTLYGMPLPEGPRTAELLHFCR